MSDKKTLVTSITANLDSLSKADLERIQHEVTQAAKPKLTPQQYTKHIMKFAGAWSDMPDDEFDAFMNDLEKRRKNWSKDREPFEP